VTEVLADVTPWAEALHQDVVGHHMPADLVVSDSHGHDLVMLQMDDATWRISHLCDRRASNRGIIRCAPELSDGHHIALVDGKVTVDPSILCSDCGLHGYIRDSMWLRV
jgi:hypothetical protein